MIQPTSDKGWFSCLFHVVQGATRFQPLSVFDDAGQPRGSAIFTDLNRTLEFARSQSSRQPELVNLADKRDLKKYLFISAKFWALLYKASRIKALVAKSREAFFTEVSVFVDPSFLEITPKPKYQGFIQFLVGEKLVHDFFEDVSLTEHQGHGIAVAKEIIDGTFAVIAKPATFPDMAAFKQAEFPGDVCFAKSKFPSAEAAVTAAKDWIDSEAATENGKSAQSS